jgi:hypothetical protein
VPEARMQVCLQDQYERTVTINDISVKFDGKSKAAEQVKPNVPNSIEEFLIKEPEFRLVKYYGPKELNQRLNSDVKSTYLLKYQHILNSEEDYVVWVHILSYAELKNDAPTTNLIEETILNNEVSKKRTSMPPEGERIQAFGFTRESKVIRESENFSDSIKKRTPETLLAMYHIFPSMSLMRAYLKTGDTTMFDIMEGVKKEHFKMIEEESKKESEIRNSRAREEYIRYKKDHSF